jgi:uncharacterized membrane protein (DUF106 family)
MKKIVFILIVAFVAIFAVSCGNAIEKDAQKLADMYCEMMDLEQEWEDAYDAEDEEKMEEIEAKVEEIDEKGEAFAEECEEKYKKEDEDEFEKLFDEYIKKCDE